IPQLTAVFLGNRGSQIPYDFGNFLHVSLAFFNGWGNFNYCDYELFAEESWNYGFAGNEFQYEEQEMGEVPFSEKNPPCVIYTDMQQIPWQLNENSVGVAAPLPESCKGIAPVERKKLIPYGCTKLRMTEMPRRVAPAGM
ncbi:MAG: hypothetical protein IJC34_08510, partial [Lentisphaeria bacterium]|nr:hypothetical protein [Lentisphaeria bacterium]